MTETETGMTATTETDNMTTDRTKMRATTTDRTGAETTGMNRDMRTPITMGSSGEMMTVSGRRLGQKTQTRQEGKWLPLK